MFEKGALMAFLGAGFSDYFNRRTLLVTGSFMLAATMTGVTLFCGLYASTQVIAYGIVAFIFLQFFGTVFSFCFTPLQCLYAVEILDFKARATGMAFYNLIVNGLAYLQNYILANGANQLGWKFFGTYIAIDLVGGFVYWKYFPETNGLSLEEVELTYLDEKGPVAASLAFRQERLRLALLSVDKKII